MKITTILIAVVLGCTLTAEANVLRRRRVTNDLKESYIVHFNNKGEPLNVAGFDAFVRALNGQQAFPGSEAPSSSYAAESPEFPRPQKATPTTASELMTTTEPATPHQPRPLATGTSRTPGAIAAATASPEPTYVTTGSTATPLKLPHEISGTSPPMAEASVATDKPTLTFALGHDAAGTSVYPGGFSLSDVSNLVTPGENSSSKITVSGLGFFHEKGLNSKIISLQPGIQTALINYAQPQVATIQNYVPVAQTAYVQTLPTNFQKSYVQSNQPEIFNYASYPNQNLAITDGNAQLQIVRQAPSLIDIGQGLGQGYRSVPQELPLSLGHGWGGIDYRARRTIPLVKPVLGIAKSGYALPVSSRLLSKIGFGPGSW